MFWNWKYVLTSQMNEYAELKYAGFENNLSLRAVLEYYK